MSRHVPALPGDAPRAPGPSPAPPDDGDVIRRALRGALLIPLQVAASMLFGIGGVFLLLILTLLAAPVIGLVLLVRLALRRVRPPAGLG